MTASCGADQSRGATAPCGWTTAISACTACSTCFYNGPIPRGHVVHHSCETKLCVNPRHLVAMTKAEHLLTHDLPAKGQPAMVAIQRAKTNCPKGHPYSGDNVRIKSGGGRGCMTCHRADAKRRADRRRACVNYAEVEVVADAGVRLRIIADGLIAGAAMETSPAYASYLTSMARHVDEVRVRLCALPIESEGEAA